MRGLRPRERRDHGRLTVPQDNGSIGLASIAAPLLHIPGCEPMSLNPGFAIDGTQTTELAVDASEPTLAQSDGRLIVARSEPADDGSGPDPFGVRDLTLSRVEGLSKLAEPVSRRGGGGRLGLGLLGVLGLAALVRRAVRGNQPT